MTKRISTLISYFFHPILMPLLGMLLILYSGTHFSLLLQQQKNAILVITAMSTILLPLSIMPFLYYHRLISKFTIPERKERLIPLFLSIVFYYFGYYVLHKFAAPFFIQRFLLASLICLTITVLIHLKWKISLHMIGIGGLTGLTSAFGFLYQLNISLVLMVLILVAGITGTARLHLRIHNQTQIYSGYMLGFTLSFGVLVFL